MARNWAAYTEKVHRWVEQGASQGAKLLVFPEYGSLELASLLGREVAASLSAQLAGMQSLHSKFVDVWENAARQQGVTVVAPSFPVRCDDQCYRNRAYVVGLKNGLAWQEKQVMTRFENEQWMITAGRELRLFRLPEISFGIAICYDGEFPLLSRRLAEAGADLIVIPSCTDTLAGYERVRLGARARALENQVYVAQAPLVGTIDWSEAIDVNVGAAGLYAPPDRGFPPNGIVAEGTMNQPEWLFAKLDLTAIRNVRKEGQVLNRRDWLKQFSGEIHVVHCE